MDIEKHVPGTGWGAGGFLGDSSERPAIGGTSRRSRKPKAVPIDSAKRPRKQIQGAGDALGDFEVWQPKGRKVEPAVAIDPKDAKLASDILNDIGQRFSENRAKGKSTAFEEYQRDISNNASYLVRGGLMTLKELSEMLMKLEEYRKHTSEQGKTPATLLAEWLRGDIQIA